MNLSNIFKTVKSLKIQDFEKHGKTKHLFKLNFPEVVSLKISRSSDLEHFYGLKLLRKIYFEKFDEIDKID